MHAEARLFVERVVADYVIVPSHVVEYGSRDINGSVREYFIADSLTFTGIDIIPGKGVDVVADAGVWRPPEPVDVIICCEVLEHTDRAQRIVNNACASLAVGGFIVITCACDSRAPHSASDGGKLREDEYYRNVDAFAMWANLEARDEFSVEEFEVHRGRGDLYVLAQKMM